MKRKIYSILESRPVSAIARNIGMAVQKTCEHVLRKVRRIPINGGEVTYDDIQLNFPDNVGRVYSDNMFWKGMDGFEPDTWKTLSILLKNANCFLDIGANLGIYSILASKRFPNIHVMAFEPVPSIHKQGTALQLLNHCKSINYRNQALSDSVGTARIRLPIVPGGSDIEQTATLRNDSWQWQSHSAEEFEINTVTLDSLLPDVVPGPLVIKCDVEDHEAQVFIGGRGLLNARRPFVVCEILFRDHGNLQTFREIAGLRYVPFGIARAFYVRFTEKDFQSRRPFQDFLLVPEELLSGDRNVLTVQDIELLSGPGNHLP